MTGTPIFAIGDIHGQRSMLEHALALIERDPAAGAPVVFLGDFVDRGPDSAGVLDLLANGQEAGRPWHPLMGNHDRMFLRYLDDPGHIDPILRHPLPWLDPRLGGRSTLASYGVKTSRLRPAGWIHRDAVEAVPARHRAFLASLARSHETDSLFFAHAGIRPGIDFADQTEDDLLWIRSPFLEDIRDHGKLVIHGHTPVESPMHCGNRVNLDSGAGYGRPLTVAVFEEGQVFTLNDGGRCPLQS